MIGLVLIVIGVLIVFSLILAWLELPPPRPSPPLDTDDTDDTDDDF